MDQLFAEHSQKPRAKSATFFISITRIKFSDTFHFFSWSEGFGTVRGESAGGGGGGLIDECKLRCCSEASLICRQNSLSKQLLSAQVYFPGISDQLESDRLFSQRFARFLLAVSGPRCRGFDPRLSFSCCTNRISPNRAPHRSITRSGWESLRKPFSTTVLLVFFFPS